MIVKTGDVFEYDVPTPEGTVKIRGRMINSSNIKWIGWPKDGSPLMIVEFSSGDRYGYLGVNRQKAVATAYAESSGSYLAKEIKPKYKVVRIR